jgi:hypothetical protein
VSMASDQTLSVAAVIEGPFGGPVAYWCSLFGRPFGCLVHQKFQVGACVASS